jgi:hypothetical protein
MTTMARRFGQAAALISAFALGALVFGPGKGSRGEAPPPKKPQISQKRMLYKASKPFIVTLDYRGQEAFTKVKTASCNFTPKRQDPPGSIDALPPWKLMPDGIHHHKGMKAVTLRFLPDTRSRGSGDLTISIGDGTAPAVSTDLIGVDEDPAPAEPAYDPCDGCGYAPPKNPPPAIQKSAR